MGIITLLTDWGTKDHFVAALKGELLSQVPAAVVVDVSHDVKHHDILEGAHIFSNCWSHFPAGTVHVIGIVAHAHPEPKTIAVKHRGHYFVGCNDGFFSLVFNEEIDSKYYLLTAEGNTVSPSLQVLADAAAFLTGGGNIADMGRPVEDFVEKNLFQSFIEDDSIRGVVSYVDSFGNIVTNISKDLFDSFGNARSFELHMRTSEYTVNKMSTEYWEAGPGNLLIRYNDKGYLEIAICGGNASKLLNLKYGNPIRIDFK
jgi:S-adenosylmethionine hydrolase